MQIIRDPAILAGYLVDASNTRGEAEALLRPGSVEELAEIVAHCQREAIPLTVSAARTSTTGGPVPHGGWVLSMERLNRVIAIGAAEAEAEAGVMLGAFQAEIAAAGRLYPPDPTSKDECTLGGSIACNASGARTFRYGPTRRWVEWVQAVLPDGSIVGADRSTPIPDEWPRVSWEEPHLKTATGFFPADNLLDLLIGQEGILAVITRARVRTLPAPAAVTSVMAFFPDSITALDFVEAARPLHPNLLEWFDRNSLDLVRARMPGLVGEAAVWFEVEGPLDPWMELLSGALDAIVAEDEAGQERLRLIRHAIPAGVNEIVARNGVPKVATDFAVPASALREMMAAYEGVPMAHVLFGHVGDSHLHLNLLPSGPGELAEARRIWGNLYHLALSKGGTLSAEHGVGKLKRAWLPEMVGDSVINQFRALKEHLDPNWILGRGTLLAPPV